MLFRPLLVPEPPLPDACPPPFSRGCFIFVGCGGSTAFIPMCGASRRSFASRPSSMLCGPEAMLFCGPSSCRCNDCIAIFKLASMGRIPSSTEGTASGCLILETDAAYASSVTAFWSGTRRYFPCTGRRNAPCVDGSVTKSNLKGHKRNTKCVFRKKIEQHGAFGGLLTAANSNTCFARHA